MSDYTVPRYRLRKGRPDGSTTAGATRMIHVALPMDLFNRVYDQCQEEEIGRGLSGMERGGAYLTDYVRAAILVFSTLLDGVSRDRLISFASLPEARMDSVIAHLEFNYAALPGDPSQQAYVLGVPAHPGIDSTKHAEMYRREQGIEDKPDKAKAPLAEKDPWNQL